MESIDLKDASYSVPILESSQKYLIFINNSQIYKFTCYPNGLSFCPRRFTKLMKVQLSILHQMGHAVIGYIHNF